MSIRRALQLRGLVPSDLSMWKLPVTLSVATLLAVCGFLLIKMLFTDTLTWQVSSIQTQVNEQENHYRINQGIIARLPTIRQDIERLSQLRRQAQQQLPTQADIPALIDQVYQLATDNGITFSEVKPEFGIDDLYYTIQPITLMAEADFLSLATFVEQVIHLTQLMSVGNISLTTKPKSRTDRTALQVSAELRTYVFSDKATGDKRE